MKILFVIYSIISIFQFPSFFLLHILFLDLVFFALNIFLSVLQCKIYCDLSGAFFRIVQAEICNATQGSAFPNISRV